MWEICTGVLALSVPVITFGGTVTVTIGTAPAPIAENFDGFPLYGEHSTLNLNGAIAGESFVGQTVTNAQITNPPYPPLEYELMSGNPDVPLTLNVVAPEDGLQILDGILGIHDLTTETPSSVYEVGSGLVSILFDVDQTLFGLTIDGESQGYLGFYGDVIFDFFERDGTLINRINISNVIDGDYTFTSDTPFAGFTIANADYLGLQYDNFRYSVVPIPAAVWLFGSGFIGFFCVFRRKKHSCTNDD